MSEPRLHHIRTLLDSSKYLLSVAGPLYLPVSTVMVFAGCALWQHRRDSNEPMSLETLAERLGKTPSALSANLLYLSDRYRDRDGLGLIRRYENPHNGRRKGFQLTEKGEAVSKHLQYLYQRPAWDL